LTPPFVHVTDRSAFAFCGKADAHATVGRLRGDRTSIGSTGAIDVPISAKTTNGGVSISLPQNAKADLSVTWTNGGVNVSPDLKVEVTEKSRRRFEGRMNGGGTPIELQTTNGGIRVRTRIRMQRIPNADPRTPILEPRLKPSVNEDKATRYHRQKRQVSIAAVAWGVLLLGGLLATGLTISLRDAAAAVSGRLVPSGWQPGVTVLVYVFLLTLLNELGSVPLSFYSGLLLERRYELSNETFGGWIADQAKSLAVGLVLGGGAAALIYWCMRLSPDHWWLVAGAAFALLIVGLTNSRRSCCCRSFIPSSRSIATRCGRGCSRWQIAPARACSAPTSGVSPTRRRKRTRRSPASAARGGFSCPTRCWPSTQTTRSRWCSRTSSRTTCTATSGRGFCSRAS